jgi:hypothetical protein
MQKIAAVWFNYGSSVQCALSAFVLNRTDARASCIMDGRRAQFHFRKHTVGLSNHARESNKVIMAYR